MAVKRAVPEIPYKVPMIQPNGFLNPAWAKWFRDLYFRVGGTLALTNTDLETQALTDIAALQVDVTALEASEVVQDATLTSLQSQIDELKIGREVHL